MNVCQVITESDASDKNKWNETEYQNKASGVSSFTLHVLFAFKELNSENLQNTSPLKLVFDSVQVLQCQTRTDVDKWISFSICLSCTYV